MRSSNVCVQYFGGNEGWWYGDCAMKFKNDFC